MELLIGSAFALVGAAVYGYVGHVVHQRPVSAAARPAAVMFAIWWYALAGTSLISCAEDLLAHFGYTDLEMFITLELVTVLTLCMALWGLLYYLLFLFTGRHRIIVPLTVFYVLNYFVLIYFVISQDPAAVVVSDWDAGLEYANEERGPFYVAVIALLLAPQFLGALAYLTFYRQVSDRTQRYRILVVSLSILIWFGSAGVASASEFGQSFTWQVVSRAIGLLAALAILAAYQPPRAIRRWLGAAVQVQPAR